LVGCSPRRGAEAGRGFQTTMTASHKDDRMARFRRALTTTGLVAALTIIVLAIVAPPWSVVDKAHWVGYGICSQLPGHTLFFNGQPLPLCARCSGTYLGAVLGIVGLLAVGRGSVAELPRGRTLLVLVAFVAMMGVEGVNSTLNAIPGAPYLYEPSNLLRLVTGLLNGLALSLVVYPLFNYVLWAEAEPCRSIERVWEVPLFFAPMAVIAWGLESGSGLLLYPLTLISTCGVLVLLTLVNTMIVVIVFRREAAAVSWRQAAGPVIGGLAVSLVELAAMIALRAALTGAIGVPA
jgi:uncharacterized membrane protein